MLSKYDAARLRFGFKIVRRADRLPRAAANRQPERLPCKSYLSRAAFGAREKIDN